MVGLLRHHRSDVSSESAIRRVVRYSILFLRLTLIEPAAVERSRTERTLGPQKSPHLVHILLCRTERLPHIPRDGLLRLA